MTLHSFESGECQCGVEKKINKYCTARGYVQYQGSQIGKEATILGGLNIEAPEGAEILVFAGHIKSMGGFNNQYSFLIPRTRPHVGTRYTTKNGIEVGVYATKVADKSQVNGSVRITQDKGR